MCIDIVEICFGIANGQISSIFELTACKMSGGEGVGWGIIISCFYLFDFFFKSL